MIRIASRRTTALSAAAVLGLVSAAQAELVYGITDVTVPVLFNFDSATPGTINVIGPVTGVNAGHSLKSIDFRPNGGALYGISTSTAGSDAQVYTINTATGAASAAGTNFALTGNTSARLSLDFNPAADRLRIVTGDTVENNFRWNPVTNAFVQADTTLAYGLGQPFTGTPLVAGVAYNNNNAGALSTTLYGYDYTNDELVTIGGVNGAPSPNLGELFNIGDTGFVTGVAALGFDISGASGVAYLSVDDAAATDTLRTANLATGLTTTVGQFPGFVLDISVAPIPEPTTLGLTAVAALGLLRRRRA